MATSTAKYQPPKRVEDQHQPQIKEIGRKLEKLREKTGMSISAYSADLGIARNSYSMMERGEIYFSLRNLLIILNHHSLDLKKFIETDIENL